MKRMQGVFAAVSILISVAAICSAADAETLYVGHGQAHTRIQSAIDAAQDGDTINVAAGVYYENLVIDGKSLFLLGGWNADFSERDWEAYETILNGNNSGRCLRWTYAENGELSGFTVANGLASGEEGQEHGGGAYLEEVSLVLRHNVFIGNTASTGHGGAIYVTGGEVQIDSNIIQENSAGVNGGGIYTYDGTPIINGNTIRGNSSSGAGSFLSLFGGGGICTYKGTPSIAGNTIIGNRADRDGGGIRADFCTPSVTGNIISGNTANRSGGGVYICYSMPSIAGNTITENTANGAGTIDGGGGIYIEDYDGTSSVTGNTISGNMANYSGGGIRIYTHEGTFNVADNTITGNTASIGGGGIRTYRGSLSITGNTIAENIASVTGGGGILSEHGTVSIAGNTISENMTNWNGGAICTEGGTFSITGNTIMENTANGTRYDNGGGAIYAYAGALSITGNTIVGNTTRVSGGAIRIYSGTPIITGNTISENISDVSGGGIFTLLGVQSITGNIITGNTAGGIESTNGGGGIFSYHCRPTMTGNTFSRNVATFGAACYFFEPVGASFSNNTVTNNQDSGNVICQDNGDLYISNSILWGNTLTEPAQIEIQNAATLTITYSNLQGGQPAVDVSRDSHLIWGSGNMNIDPLFACPENGNYHLKSVVERWHPDGNDGAGDWVVDRLHSPCIAAGDPDSDFSNEPEPNGGRVNMGAFGNTQYASKAAERILTVQSNPIDGVSISGDKPGSTVYMTAASVDEMIELIAPETTLHGGMRYLFDRWQLNENTQPEGETHLQITMDTNYTATAFYRLKTHTLTVESAPITGIEITGTKPGITSYISNCEDQERITLHAPLLVYHEGHEIIRYDFVHWTLDGEPQSEPSTALSFTAIDNHTAVAVYEIRTHTVAVESAPITGVEITGYSLLQDPGGTTNYTQTFTDQAVVLLHAPMVHVAAEGTRYDFLHWLMNDEEHTVEDNFVALKLGADQTLVAVYELRRHQVQVQSEPIAGFEITGDLPGVTNYATIAEDQGKYSFTAPVSATVLGFQCHFSHWVVDGLPHEDGVNTITVKIDSGKTIKAVFTFAEYYVDLAGTYGFSTIQSAIDAAQNGDTIKVAAGVYKENLVINKKSLFLLGGWNADFTERDPTAYETVIDGSQDGRCIKWTDADGGELSGFKVTNGSAYEEGVEVHGGGVYLEEVSLILSHNVFIGNTASAGHGGAIYVVDGEVQIENNVIANNSAGGNGGGIYISSGMPTITGNTITENTASGTGHGWVAIGGGGISTYDAASTIIGNTIIGNTASDGCGGGGINAYYGTLSIIDNVITGNTADSSGGGIYTRSADTLSITGNTITANTVGNDGGAIFTMAGTHSITGNTISGNNANKNGGGIETDYGTPTITGNTITANTVNLWDGGGIHTYHCTPTITGNTITANITGNSGGGIFTWDGTPTITTNTITENTASGTGDSTGGGGVYAYQSTLSIIDNTVSRNTAVNNGGGIHVSSGTAIITGNVIIDNSVTGTQPSYGGGGIFTDRGTPSITTNLIAGNLASTGGGCYLLRPTYAVSFDGNTLSQNHNDTGNAIHLYGGALNISNTILWGNTSSELKQIAIQKNAALTITYSNVRGGQPAVDVSSDSHLIWSSGNMNIDPLFADPENGDFHLKSQYGRWSPSANDAKGGWEFDDVTSPCIAAGDPSSDYHNEPQPNGGRINIGAYGNTPYASKASPWWLIPGDATHTCTVELADLVLVRNRTGAQTGDGDNWRADVNNDGNIDILDLVYVRNRLGADCRCTTVSPDTIETTDRQAIIFVNSMGFPDTPPDVVNVKLNGTTVLANVTLNKWHLTDILDLKPDDVNNVEVEYVSGGSDNCVSADVILEFFPSGEQQLGTFRVGLPAGNEAAWTIFCDAPEEP